jgi:hypothetical protein
MDLPLAIALQSPEHEHLGFLLLSPNDPTSGSCIFMLLPQKPEVFESALYRALEPYGFRDAGEHRLLVQPAEGGIIILVSCEALSSVELFVTPDGAGTFRVLGDLELHGDVRFQVNAA